LSNTARFFVFVGCVALAAPGCGPTDATDLSVAVPMDFVRTVAAPQVDDVDPWLSQPSRIRYDGASGTLFTREWADVSVQEFSRSGEHIREYGGVRGEGPGEIDNMRTYDIGPDYVVIHDGGGAKILRFDRRDASLISEFSLGRMVYDMTVVGDTAIALIPGTDGSAFDLLDLDGNPLASAGDGGFLTSGICRCLIRDIGAGRVVIVRTTLAEGRVLSLDGHLREAFGFHELAHVLAQWSEDFREKLREMGTRIAEGAPGRVASGRYYVSEVVGLGDGTFYAILVPEKTHEEPLEIWVMDRKARVSGRYAYQRTRVGAHADGFPTVFGVGFDDGSIHEFHVRQ
jgi:hypothetical protein